VIDAAVMDLAIWRGHGFRDQDNPDAPDPAGLTHGFEGLAVDHIQAGLEAVAAMAGIMAVHARAGTRPTWSRESPHPFPDRGGNGKPRVLIDEIFVEAMTSAAGSITSPTRNPPIGAVTFREPVACPPTRKGLYRAGAYCPLVWRPDPARLVTERAEYAAWRMGLELLQASLERTLFVSRAAACRRTMAAVGGGGRSAWPTARALPRATGRALPARTRDPGAGSGKAKGEVASPPRTKSRGNPASSSFRGQESAALRLTIHLDGEGRRQVTSRDEHSHLREAAVHVAPAVTHPSPMRPHRRR